jgi:hypothetical protein
MHEEDNKDVEFLSSIDEIKQRHYSFLLESLNENLKGINFNDPIFEKIYKEDKKVEGSQFTKENKELILKITNVSNDLYNHLANNSNVNLKAITKFFQSLPEYLRLLIIQYILDSCTEESLEKMQEFVNHNPKDFIRIQQDT